MGNSPSAPHDEKSKYKSFPGSAILEKAICGSIDTTDPSEYQDSGALNQLMRRAEVLCVSSPMSAATDEHVHFFDEEEEDNSVREHCNPTSLSAGSKLLAKALVSEVTDTCMNQKDIENREKKLLKAQKAAKDGIGKPVGAAGPPHVLRSVALACTGDDMPLCNADDSDDELEELEDEEEMPASPYQVTLGISLSRRHSCGHASTITRQTAYDFNELQDRQYKYVSATDATGWRAGGGEPGQEGENSKAASPDSVHIPIIRIDCPNPEAVDSVISALASGEIFIPHMSILPESLSVNGVSPPDLVVKFGCERNDDLPPVEWPNWTLEFMHNQLYDFFYTIGARWTKRSFQITLAQKVRWKTVKHMNRYFANAEKVMEAWREKGPQYLDPVVSHLDGGASKEEVVRPHGIYMFRNGVPTNYFPPNFDPPYTTKMTRSLLLTVLDKSWDKKRRDWTSRPVPRVVDAAELMVVACGCGDGDGTIQEGFVAQEATSPAKRKVVSNNKRPSNVQKQDTIVALSEVEFGDDDEEERKPGNRGAKYGTAEEDVLKAKRSKRFSIQSDDGENCKSVTQSTTYQSVAESGTTVMHGNLTKKLTGGIRSPLHSEGKKLFSDEDFLDDSPSPKPAATRPRKSPRESLKKHHQREKKKELTKVNEGDENRSPKRPHTRKKKTGYTMEATSPKSKVFEPSLAAASLEYSTDGSSSMFPQDVSLLGQQFAADPKKSISKQPTLEEEEQILSLQASTDGSLQSIVPSDEELFAVGWAKALDANSGNYYYFTLDRTRTVWENPLSSDQCAGEQKKLSIDP